METLRARLVVAYDGFPFRGFAAQEGIPTVAGASATPWPERYGTT